MRLKVETIPKIAAIAVVVALTTSPAFAGGQGDGKKIVASWVKSTKSWKPRLPAPCQVPEIDAASGMAAIAAVGACLALARDRSKTTA